ncbi:uncharacterized protein PGTG_21622 [Puccinia graminis f. sp. tritici CRL 75-36-700-3]|uniref:Uncharacterized protein n=1 Tax=Puccinia graminis f. sp. tritici (strain CRL 75-36-700-3 / race SCCL) TaxID=418459 RepID=H6QRM3_PUCGT|nr:uncharacterized protein PGTG_21622 [Puccinia graminis f. sp. tritici CRL 75-36-700-3]EHS63317.1 hypothetical protein PGTG_21622 [Puccinia graminis f. sp. tritici CRL 75-36-700-3]
MPDKTTQGEEQTTESTRTADASDMQTAKDWFKAVFKIQHALITQAQEDHQQAIADRRADQQIFLAAHQANAARIGRLEDLLLAMNVKNEVDARPVQAAPGRVDLQKFRTSDGPIYRGPFQETEPFLRWIHGVQIFFDTKDVSNSADRIKILGNLIAETNLQLFYANKASGFLTKSWNEFKVRMFDFALPTNWRSGLQRQVRKLEMSPTESFLEAHVDIPANYQAPAKPVDYSAPRAWSSPSGPSSTPGKPTQPPAGRPSARAASVAGVTDITPLEAQVSVLQLDAAIREDGRWDTYFDDEGYYPSMEPAAVAALKDLDRQLLPNKIEKAKQADLADAIAGHPGRA